MNTTNIRIEDDQGLYPSSKQLLPAARLQFDHYISLPGDIQIFVIHYLSTSLLYSVDISVYCEHPLAPSPPTTARVISLSCI